MGMGGGGGGSVGGGVGAIIGGISGSVIGAVAAHQENKAFRTSKKRIRLAGRQAQEFADEQTAKILEGPEFQALRNFVLGEFTGDPSGSAAFVNNLRQRQSARGLFFSPEAAKDESEALGQFAFARRMSLLPQLAGLATYEVDTNRRLFRDFFDTRTYEATGGTQVYGQRNPLQRVDPLLASLQVGTAAAAAGQSIGSSIGGAFGGMGGGGGGGGGGGIPSLSGGYAPGNAGYVPSYTPY